jgi:MFS family permease
MTESFLRRLRADSPGLVLALAAFLTQFDVTAVVVAMPSIGNELELSISGFAWVMDAYSLMFTAALLSAGVLADRIGRRRALLAGNALFVAASLICAWAPDGLTLCVARGAQGVGAAFAVTGAIALIAGIYVTTQDRTRAFALMGIVSGVAMALGPTLGGVTAEWFGWRWIFLANLPPCVVITWAVPRLVAETRVNDGRTLDVPGIAVLTAALAIIIASLLKSHDAPLPAIMGIAVGMLLVGYFVWQQQRRTQPIFDRAVFTQPAMVGIVSLLLAVSVGYWAILVYLPLFLEAGFGWPAQSVGAALLCATAPMLVMPAFGGHLAMRWGWRALFALALVMLSLGNALLVAASLSTDRPLSLTLAVLGMVCAGVGAGLAHPQLSGAIVALIPAEQAGMASAITVAFRQGGFAVGIAALGALLVHPMTLSRFAWPFLLAVAVSAAGAVAALTFLPAKSPETGVQPTDRPPYPAPRRKACGKPPISD